MPSSAVETIRENIPKFAASLEVTEFKDLLNEEDIKGLAKADLLSYFLAEKKKSDGNVKGGSGYPKLSTNATKLEDKPIAATTTSRSVLQGFGQETDGGGQPLDKQDGDLWKIKVSERREWFFNNAEEIGALSVFGTDANGYTVMAIDVEKLAGLDREDQQMLYIPMKTGNNSEMSVKVIHKGSSKYNAVYTSSKAEVGFLSFFSGSASQSTSSKTATKGEQLHATVKHVQPFLYVNWGPEQWKILFDKGVFKLTAQFERDLGHCNEFADFRRLCRKYGEIVPSNFIVGSMRFSEGSFQAEASMSVQEYQSQIQCAAAFEGCTVGVDTKQLAANSKSMSKASFQNSQNTVGNNGDLKIVDVMRSMSLLELPPVKEKFQKRNKLMVNGWIGETECTEFVDLKRPNGGEPLMRLDTSRLNFETVFSFLPISPANLLITNLPDGSFACAFIYCHIHDDILTYERMHYASYSTSSNGEPFLMPEGICEGHTGFHCDYVVDYNTFRAAFTECGHLLVSVECPDREKSVRIFACYSSHRYVPVHSKDDPIYRNATFWLDDNHCFEWKYGDGTTNIQLPA